MNPAANDFGIWFGCFALVVSVVANVALIVGSHRKQKRDISFEVVPVSKEDFDNFVAQNRLDHGELHERINRAKDDYNHQIKNVPSEVLAVLVSIDKLKK